MVIDIHSSAIRGLVREVTSRDGQLDTSFSPPETSGSSEVLDSYCSVLEDLLELVGRYSGLVAQDTAMVESLVDEMETADEQMTTVMASISSGPGSMVGV